MMKHAYLIIAHHEWRVLETLLTMLDDERNDVYLHIDKRAGELRKQVEHYSMKSAGLYVLPHPMKVRWGNFSLVEVEFRLFREALLHGPYRYYHLLSGVDLPIKSQDYIHAFFEQHRGKEFVGFFHGAVHEADIRKKMAYFYILNDQKKQKDGWEHGVLSLFRNVFMGCQKILWVRRPVRFDCKKGSNWVSITQEFCEYLVRQCDADMVRRFRYTLCPDELFLHTVIWNSPFRCRIYDMDDMQRGSMRKIDWDRGNPYTWEEKDLAELLQSDLLFARKFSSRDLSVVNRIREAVGGSLSENLGAPIQLSC